MPYQQMHITPTFLINIISYTLPPFKYPLSVFSGFNQNFLTRNTKLLLKCFCLFSWENISSHSTSLSAVVITEVTSWGSEFLGCHSSTSMERKTTAANILGNYSQLSSVPRSLLCPLSFVTVLTRVLKVLSGIFPLSLWGYELHVENKPIVLGITFGPEWISEGLKAVPTLVWGGSSFSVCTDLVVCFQTYRVCRYINSVMLHKVAIVQLSVAALPLYLLKTSYNDGQCHKQEVGNIFLLSYSKRLRLSL